MGLRVSGIQKSFWKQPVLRGISFDLPKGTFAALLGRNGVGKSTLMKILMREEVADEGNATLAGLSLEDDHPEWGAAVISVGEGFSYAVPETVAQFFTHYSRFFPRWDRPTFERLLLSFGVPTSKHITQLSRGQQVQVRLASALAARPQLLLLDEVTAVLDARSRQIALREFSRFSGEGGTVVLATNVASEVNSIAGHVLVLEEGRLVLNQNATELGRNYFKVRLNPKQPEPDFMKLLTWVRLARNTDGTDSYVTRVASERLPEIPDALRDRRAVTIEDVFLWHTGQEAGAISEVRAA